MDPLVALWASGVVMMAGALCWGMYLSSRSTGVGRNYSQATLSGLISIPMGDLREIVESWVFTVLKIITNALVYVGHSFGRVTRAIVTSFVEHVYGRKEMARGAIPSFFLKRITDRGATLRRGSGDALA